MLVSDSNCNDKLVTVSKCLWEEVSVTECYWVFTKRYWGLGSISEC